jgi:peptidoglycan/xylan/chitin deacetylase (PgdA/CDA1 family)
VRRRGWGTTAFLGATVLTHLAPSVLVLPTFWARPPEALPVGWCRWRGPAEGTSVALTFDDGPSVETPRTLQLLDCLGMRATFFVLGSQARAFPELVRGMVDGGHEVATHGFAHRHHLWSSPRAIADDLGAAVATHQELVGQRPRFYRPTYGQLTAGTLVEARRHRLETVLWSRWGKEFKESRPEEVLRRLEPGLYPGAIVLLHDVDISCRAGTGALTHRTLPLIKTALESRGLQAVPLGELLDAPDRQGAA